MIAEHKKSEPPKVLTEAGLSMFVDTRKIEKLLLPLIGVPLEDLIWHFDLPLWSKDGTDDWNLTPWEVIGEETGTMTHYERTMKADLSYPILVTKYQSRLVILDGVHRLAKAFINGQKRIKAKIVSPEILASPEFKIDSKD